MFNGLRYELGLKPRVRRTLKSAFIPLARWRPIIFQNRGKAIQYLPDDHVRYCYLQ